MAHLEKDLVELSNQKNIVVELLLLVVTVEY